MSTPPKYLMQEAIWDEDWNFLGTRQVDLAGRPIALFPDRLAALTWRADWGFLDTALRLKHVGRQYLDNSGLAAHDIDSYTTVDLALGVGGSAGEGEDQGGNGETLRAGWLHWDSTPWFLRVGSADLTRSPPRLSAALRPDSLRRGLRLCLDLGTVRPQDRPHLGLGRPVGEACDQARKLRPVASPVQQADRISDDCGSGRIVARSL